MLLPVLLSFLGEAVAATLVPRQFNATQKLRALKIENIQPETNVPGAKRIRLLYGPYTLNGANATSRVGNSKSMDRGGTSWQSLVDDDFPKDVTVLSAKSEVQTDSFKRALPSDGIYNHHNIFMHLDKTKIPVFGCSTGQIEPTKQSHVLFAGATETGFVDYYARSDGLKTGYYVGKDSKISNSIDVINYNNRPVEVYTLSEIEYVEGNPTGYLDAFQANIDPQICGGPNGGAIHPPQGVSKFSVNSTNIMMKDGYFVNLRGHMHDGGVNAILRVNGKEVCNSKAVYGGANHSTKLANGRIWETIRESTRCLEPIKVKKGDELYFQANYDTDLHPSRAQGGHSEKAGGMEDAEQMALMVTAFALIK